MEAPDHQLQSIHEAVKGEVQRDGDLCRNSARSRNHHQLARSCENPGSSGCSFSSYSSADGSGSHSCTWIPSIGNGSSRLHHSPSSVATSSAGDPSHSQSPVTNSCSWNSSTGTSGGGGHYSAPGVRPGVEEASATPTVVCFNGCPNCLAHFLAHAWHYMEHYGVMYPDDVTCVHVIMVSLEENTLE